MPGEFPRVSWGTCETAYCRMPDTMLYDRRCWECRFLLATLDEARTWDSDRFWEMIDGLPEPIPATPLRVLWERMRRLARGESDRYPLEGRKTAHRACQRIAAYGEKHYPKNRTDTP